MYLATVPITWLDSEALSGLGTLGLVAGMMLFLYWLFASGRVLTRAQVQRMLDAQDKYNAKQDKTIEYLMSTKAALVHALEQVTDQNAQLLEANKITNDFYAKVPVTGHVTLPREGDSS